MIGGPLHKVLTIERQRALHAATQILTDILVQEICDLAGLDYVTFHEFTRHGHGSLIAALNVDTATLKRRMGHLKIETTFGSDVHGVVGADQATAGLLDATLRDAVAEAVSRATVADGAGE